MKTLHGLLLSVCVLLTACGGGGGGGSEPEPVQAPEAEVVRTIAYYGDSTIHGWDGANGGQVARPAPSFVQVPGYQIINYGLGGDSTTQLLAGTAARLPWSTLIKQSDAAVVIINHAINDSDQISVADYKANLNAIIDGAAGKKLIFETPNPIGKVLSFGPLTDYVAAMREVAAARNIQLIDQHAYITGVIKSQPLIDFMPDLVHPNQATYQIKGEWANAMLNSLL